MEKTDALHALENVKKRIECDLVALEQPHWSVLQLGLIFGLRAAYSYVIQALSKEKEGGE